MSNKDPPQKKEKKKKIWGGALKHFFEKKYCRKYFSAKAVHSEVLPYHSVQSHKSQLQSKCKSNFYIFCLLCVPQKNSPVVTNVYIPKSVS